MSVVAVDPPEAVAAAGPRPLGVIECDALGRFRVAYVENTHAGAGLAVLTGLVGYQHGVADDRQGVGAQVVIVQVGLGHDLRVGQIGNVHAGKVLGRAFVGHVENAASVGCLVQVHSLAEIVVPVQINVGYELHVFDFLGLS